MAVAATHLTTAGSTTDATSYPTASVSPTANNLVLIWVYWTKTTGTVAVLPSSVTGNGLNWVLVNSTLPAGTATGAALYRAMGAAPSAGAITVTFAATITGLLWSVSQFSGVDTGGTDGSAAVVQSAVNNATATSLTVTLAAFGSANNATVGGFGHAAAEATVQGSGFSLLGTANHATPNHGIGSEFNASNDTTVDASWTTSSVAMGVAAELKAAAVVITNTGATMPMMGV